MSTNRCKCGADDWKSLSLVYESNTHTIQTETRGSTTQRGDIFASANHSSKTSGTQSSALAQRCRPPTTPDGRTRSQIKSEIESAISAARDAITSIDQWASDRSSLKIPFLSFRDNSKTIASQSEKYKTLTKEFNNRKNQDVAMQKWKFSRLCNRCGDIYITADDLQKAEINDSVPMFVFEGQSRTCSECSSYDWKEPEIYFELSIADKEQNIANAEKTLADARAHAENPNGKGFFKKLVNKVMLPDVDSAEQRLTAARLDLDVLNSRIASIKSEHDNKEFRMCLDCDQPYVLPDTGMAR